MMNVLGWDLTSHGCHSCTHTSQSASHHTVTLAVERGELSTPSGGIIKHIASRTVVCRGLIPQGYCAAWITWIQRGPCARLTGKHALHA
jgi:hypothetical protein